MSRPFATGFEPGMRVRHPDCPDWGPGIVQSVDGHRVTVAFEEAGKVLVNTAVVMLTACDDDSSDLRSSARSLK